MILVMTTSFDNDTFNKNNYLNLYNIIYSNNLSKKLTIHLEIEITTKIWYFDK